MKIRLEPNKTTLRLSKIEFSELLKCRFLSDSYELPGDQAIDIYLKLEETDNFIYENNSFRISLPNRLIDDYKPCKNGLTFYFQLDNKKKIQVLFEVDIKKKPINK